MSNNIMETPVNNTVKLNEQWIKVGFNLFNDKIGTNDYVTSDQTTEFAKALNELKNLCLCNPIQYMKEYGVTLYDYLKQEYEGITNASLKYYVREESNIEQIKESLKEFMIVTGFTSNVVHVANKGPKGGYWVINYAEGRGSTSGHEPGSGLSQLDELRKELNSKLSAK